MVLHTPKRYSQPHHTGGGGPPNSDLQCSDVAGYVPTDANVAANMRSFAAGVILDCVALFADDLCEWG